MKAITQTFPFPEIEKLELSNSSRCTLHSCPRKLEFRKIYNNSRKTESLAMGSGSALHAGIQSWLTHHDETLAFWEMIKVFPIRYQKSWSEQRSLVSCYMTLKAMIEWERIDEFELAYITKPDGSLVPGVEVSFTLRISNYPFYPDGRTITVDYVGYIDLVMFNKFESEIAVWDVKSTTKNIDHTPEYQYADQCLPYGLAIQALMGYDVNKGFEVNYWTAYTDALEPKNLLYTFNKTQQDVQDWMQGYMFDLDMIRRYYNLGWFARHGQSCMSWGRPCVFFDFCNQRDPKVIETFLRMDEEQKVNERPKPWVVIELDYEEGAI